MDIKKKSIKSLATNRKARHEYHIEDTFEAGVKLIGTEVKALRLGKVNLQDGWVDINESEAYLCDVHINPYSHGNIHNHDAKRQRKLLLHKRELVQLEEASFQKGMAIIPLSIYLKGSLIKLQIAIARGKKQFDKRESNKEREANREMERAMRKSFK